MRAFITFVIISGFGWLIDFFLYFALTHFFSLPIAVANMCSAIVGVTFVWFNALDKVFHKSDSGVSIYILIYWIYQLLSILCYSILMSILAAFGVSYFNDLRAGYFSPEVFVKLFLTPFNLLTNFLFMKILTVFMKTKD